MNQNKKHYNKLKRYYKLLLKNHNDLNDTKYNYSPCFNKPMREVDLVNSLLSTDKELEATYHLYQDLLHAIKTSNINTVKQLLDHNHQHVSNYMLTSIETLKNYIDYIDNSLSYPYTNGKLEGKNNLIKVIKRISFGYRSFYNFKIRILIVSGLLKPAH